MTSMTSMTTSMTFMTSQSISQLPVEFEPTLEFFFLMPRVEKINFSSEASFAQIVPKETALEIFQWLAAVDLTRSSLTCKQWYLFIKQNKKKLWVPKAIAFNNFLITKFFHSNDEYKIRSEYDISNLYKSTAQVYDDIYLNGKKYLKKMSALKKTIQQEEKTHPLKPNSLTERQISYEALIDIEFAASQIGLGSYEKFFKSSVKYVGALKELSSLHKEAFIENQIVSLVKAKLFDSRMENFNKIYENNSLSCLNLSKCKKIIDFCNKNMVNEAIDVIEKHPILSMTSWFEICVGNILTRCIKLNDKTSIIRLAKLIYAEYNSGQYSEPRCLRCLLTKQQVKISYDLYQLFKNDPAIAEYSNKYSNGFFPFGETDDFHNLIMRLIDEGYDDDAIELYKICAMKLEDKVECLGKMAALFKAKDLPNHAEIALSFIKDQN